MHTLTNPIDLFPLSTAELREDLIRCRVDIIFCQTAERLGVEQYENEPVHTRLERDRRIQDAIEQELARRGELEAITI
jgi:hypothetical protein